MSLSVDGVWKSGVWATTVWGEGVWREGAAAETPTVTVIGGGKGKGRRYVSKIKERWVEGTPEELDRIIRENERQAQIHKPVQSNKSLVLKPRKRRKRKNNEEAIILMALFGEDDDT